MTETMPTYDGEPVRPGSGPCPCGARVDIDPERLARLRDSLRRNTTAVERTIEQILAELDPNRIEADAKPWARRSNHR